MRLAFAALLALAPLPAGAEAAGNAATRAALAVSKQPQARVFDFPGDVDWFRVRLAKGADYYLTAACGCRFDIRDSAGRVLARGTAGLGGDISRGFEFRAPRKGLFFAEFADDGSAAAGFYPYPYDVVLSGDCAGGPRTRCEVLPGQSRSGALADGYDRDGFRVPMRAGLSYAVTLTHPPATDVELTVLAPNGRLVWLGGSTTVTATVTGSYLVVVGTEDERGGGGYGLAVSAPSGAR